MIEAHTVPKRLRASSSALLFKRMFIGPQVWRQRLLSPEAKFPVDFFVKTVPRCGSWLVVRVGGGCGEN